MVVLKNKVYPDVLPLDIMLNYRPLNIVSAERRATIRVQYFSDGFKQNNTDIPWSVQNGDGVKGCGSVSIITFGIMAALNAASGYRAFQGDIKNNYNEIKRESTLETPKENDKLDTGAFMQALLNLNTHSKYHTTVVNSF